MFVVSSLSETKKIAKIFETEDISASDTSRSNGVSSDSQTATEEFRTVIYSLVKAVVKGDLKKDKAVSYLAEAVNLHPKLGSIIGDVFAVLDTESQLGKAEDRERFTILAKSCADFMCFMFMERLDQESLQDCGVIPNKKVFSTKIIRTKTRL